MNNPLGPGAPPYGFAHPPGPPPHHHKTSGLAIAALVLGLTGCLVLPLLPAIIVGVIALTQTGPAKRPGRGLAIGGLAAAGFWAIGWVALLGNTMDDLRHDTAGPQSAGCATPSPGHADACTLKPGECFEQPKVKGTFDSVELTSCGNAHSTEAIGAFTAADGPWPGAEKLRAEAVSECQRIMAKNVDRPRLEAAGVYADLSYLAPGRESWENGVRTVFCTIYSPDAQLTASVLTSGADLAIPTG